MPKNSSREELQEQIREMRRIIRRAWIKLFILVLATLITFCAILIALVVHLAKRPCTTLGP